MPKAMEMALKKEANKKGLTGSHADAYVYGTMRKTGWTPSHPRGFGGAGHSPCKMMKREGGMNNEEMMWDEKDHRMESKKQMMDEGEM